MDLTANHHPEDVPARSANRNILARFIRDKSFINTKSVINFRAFMRGFPPKTSVNIPSKEKASLAGVGELAMETEP